MHYSKYAFSNGNGPTMRMKGCIKCELGQRKGFSALDVQGINSFYGCVPWKCSIHSAKCQIQINSNQISYIIKIWNINEEDELSKTRYNIIHSHFINRQFDCMFYQLRTAKN